MTVLGDLAVFFKLYITLICSFIRYDTIGH